MIFLFNSLSVYNNDCIIILCALITKDDIFNVNFTYNALFAIFYTAIFASVIAYLIQIGVQRFTTPTKTAIMFTAEPLSAPFFPIL